MQSREADLTCTTGWSDWINQDILDQSSSQNVKTSKSNYFKQDDIEPLPTNMQMKNMRGSGKAVCSSDFFAAVECRTVVDHSNPKKTGQNVECSLERGLLCKGQCFDFEIRVYCECGDLTKVATSPKPFITTQQPRTTVPFIVAPIILPPTTTFIKICDPKKPNVEHPHDCFKFLHCAMSSNGSLVYVEKTCGDTMMFNPKAMVCDWSETVKAMKPSCGLTTTSTGAPIKYKECPFGYVYSNCAIPCNRACHYYNQQLKLSGNCTMGSNDCIPGCMPIGSAVTCEHPKLWRDWQSCVDMQACTCIGPSNEILKPGQVIHVSECKTCQCLNNEIICANVPCAKKPSTLPPLLVSSTVRPIETAPIVSARPPRVIPSYITICDPSIPHVEHPNSCYKFLHCQPTLNGSYVYAIKSCYPDMMFNPKAMVCDWPASVIAMKPACGKNPGEITIETWESEETIKIKTRTPQKTTASSAFRSSTTKTIINYGEEGKPYYIRACDISVSLVEHPESCFKYLQCQQMGDGSSLFVEKTCGDSLMFNPKSQVCDWPFSVQAMKPVCNTTPGDFEIFDLIGHTDPVSFTTRYASTPGPFKIIQSSLRPPLTSAPGPIDYPYYITICDPSIPHIEHPNSCYKFLHCQPAVNGSYIYAVKTCYPDMMFNPKSMICDWPAAVKAMKPACGSNPGEIEIWETEEIITKRRSSRIPITTQRSIFQPSTPGTDVGYGEGVNPIYTRACSLADPIFESSFNCYNYYECSRLANGSYQYVEKTCGPDMMFNKKSKACSWPNDVMANDSKCGTSPSTAKPHQTTQNAFITTQKPIIVPTTLTPPMLCDQGFIVPMLNLLPDSAFSASSILSDSFKPEFSRLDSKPGDKNGGSWSPRTNDLNQFLQVTFPQAVPVHGIIIRGNPMFDQYVTSFKMLHSYDSNTYHVYENSKNRPNIFSGSVDSRTPVKSIFDVPIEAKIIRIYPISWHGSIALRIEVLGCQKPSQPIVFTPEVPRSLMTSTLKPTTPPIIFIPTVNVAPGTTRSPMFTEAPIEPLCEDPLGVENGQISSSQIKFSSIKDSGSVKTKVRKNPLEIIKLSSARGWMPLTDSLNEFVMVSFIHDTVEVSC